MFKGGFEQFFSRRKKGFANWTAQNLKSEQAERPQKINGLKIRLDLSIVNNLDELLSDLTMSLEALIRKLAVHPTPNGLDMSQDLFLVRALIDTVISTEIISFDPLLRTISFADEDHRDMLCSIIGL
jgi:hypothetical protein